MASLRATEDKTCKRRLAKQEQEEEEEEEEKEKGKA